MIIDGLGAGGVERRMLGLVEHLIHQDSGYNITIVVLSRKFHYKKILELPVNLYFIERKPKKDPRVFFRIYKICKKFKPDIIQVWGSQDAVYALPSKLFLRIKMVNSMIMDAPSRLPFSSWIRSKITFPFSDIITSNSKAGINTYHPPSNKCIVIYNGFDFKRISHISDTSSVKHKFGIPEDKYIVGMVARFEKHKDHQTLLAAAEDILKKRNDVIFLLVGEGSLFEYYRKKYTNSYTGRIYFLGAQENVEEIVNTFDIGILATFTEGISNTIMEYMALKKTVIATAGGGTNEIINNNETGYLVLPKDSVDLADKILFLLNNNDTREKFGIEGYNRIVKYFSMDRMADEYIKVYNNLLKK